MVRLHCHSSTDHSLSQSNWLLSPAWLHKAWTQLALLNWSGRCSNCRGALIVFCFLFSNILLNQGISEDDRCEVIASWSSFAHPWMSFWQTHRAWITRSQTYPTKNAKVQKEKTSQVQKHTALDLCNGSAMCSVQYVWQWERCFAMGVHVFVMCNVQCISNLFCNVFLMCFAMGEVSWGGKLLLLCIT